MILHHRHLYRALFLGLGLLTTAGASIVLSLWIDSRPSGPIGPYLQRPAPDAVSIHWRTADAGPSRFEWRPLGSATWQAEPVQDGLVDHDIRLEGLSPASGYEYRIEGNGIESIAHRFHTPPARGAAVPIRAWVLGDPGRANEITASTRRALEAWQRAHPRPGLPPVDLILTTGDNAYPDGRDRDYRSGFFAPWAPWLADVPVWPIIGNHDARRWAYDRIFDFPENGESGGLASGSNHYFAFDEGPVHFVVLDSETSDLSPDGPMARWLKADLAANESDWALALFHRPPYSHGRSHNSDHPEGSDWRMTAMREVFVPLLEDGGVDLVLSGHSHVYERILPRGSGAVEIDAAAREPRTNGPDTTFIVVGNSSTAQDSPLDHPRTAHAEATPGALVLDITPSELSGHFVRADGSVGDTFRLVARTRS